MRATWLLGVMGLFACACCVQGQDRPSIGALVAKINAVDKEGAGHVEAARAWQELVGHGPNALVDILTAMDDPTPRAGNWLRTAVDAIAEKSLTVDKTLPVDRLEALVKDTKRSGPARRQAYEWLLRIDPSAADRLLPGMLDDPGAELRRDAVAVVLRDGDKLLETDKAAATTSFKKALHHARDRDQVVRAAEKLGKLGVAVDLTRQLGFVTRWHLIGPFDNVKNVGFEASYPPEKGYDPSAAYVAKEGKKVQWQEHVTELPFGLVDLNRAVGALKGAVVYGHAVVEAGQEQPVEVRCGSNNAVRIYLNGTEIYFRDEYHHGMQMDQHVGKGTLRAGKNEILIKVCQNEQTESWAQQWSFQLRLCDALGAAVP